MYLAITSVRHCSRCFTWTHSIPIMTPSGEFCHCTHFMDKETTERLSEMSKGAHRVSSKNWNPGNQAPDHTCSAVNHHAILFCCHPSSQKNWVCQTLPNYTNNSSPFLTLFIGLPRSRIRRDSQASDLLSKHLFPTGDPFWPESFVLSMQCRQK